MAERLPRTTGCFLPSRTWPYLLGKTCLIACILNIVTCVARKEFRYIVRQIVKDPDKAMKQFMKNAPPSDREAAEERGRHAQLSVECRRVFPQRLERADRIDRPTKGLPGRKAPPNGVLSIVMFL
jgi:hypothetical protein